MSIKRCSLTWWQQIITKYFSEVILEMISKKFANNIKAWRMPWTIPSLNITGPSLSSDLLPVVDFLSEQSRDAKIYDKSGIYFYTSPLTSHHDSTTRLLHLLLWHELFLSNAHSKIPQMLDSLLDGNPSSNLNHGLLVPHGPWAS